MRGGEVDVEAIADVGERELFGCVGSERSSTAMERVADKSWPSHRIRLYKIFRYCKQDSFVKLDPIYSVRAEGEAAGQAVSVRAT